MKKKKKKQVALDAPPTEFFEGKYWPLDSKSIVVHNIFKVCVLSGFSELCCAGLFAHVIPMIPMLLVCQATTQPILRRCLKIAK